MGRETGSPRNRWPPWRLRNREKPYPLREREKGRYTRPAACVLPAAFCLANRPRIGADLSLWIPYHAPRHGGIASNETPPEKAAFHVGRVLLQQPAGGLVPLGRGPCLRYLSLPQNPIFPRGGLSRGLLHGRARRVSAVGRRYGQTWHPPRISSL